MVLQNIWRFSYFVQNNCKVHNNKLLIISSFCYRVTLIILTFLIILTLIILTLIIQESLIVVKFIIDSNCKNGTYDTRLLWISAVNLYTIKMLLCFLANVSFLYHSLARSSLKNSKIRGNNTNVYCKFSRSKVREYIIACFIFLVPFYIMSWKLTTSASRNYFPSHSFARNSSITSFQILILIQILIRQHF